MKIAIEIEFNQKFGQKLDETIIAIIQSIHEGKFDCYFFFVRSPVIAENYLKMMDEGNEIPYWIQNSKNIWVRSHDQYIVVPNWLKEKVFFLPAEEEFEDPRPIEFGL